MECLRESDLREVSRCLRTIYAVRELESFPDRVMSALRRIVPATNISYNEIDTRRRRLSASVQAVEATRLPQAEQIFAAHVHEHPVLAHHRRTGEGRALKISDFLPQQRFHRLGLYQNHYRPLGTEYQISTALSGSKSRVIALAWSRDRCDFSERDRTVIELVRPHIVQAYRTADAVAKHERRLRALESAVDGWGLGVIALDRDGRVALMTGAARLRLEQLFGRRACANQGVPTMLRQWVAARSASLQPRDDAPPALPPLELPGPDGSLVVHFVPAGEASQLSFLYLQCESKPVAAAPPAMIPGLTPREGEVLSWVARGKTNADIGSILGISEKTVDKHLQHIFPKLGVETRTAAAAVALDRMAAPLD